MVDGNFVIIQEKSLKKASWCGFLARMTTFKVEITETKSVVEGEPPRQASFESNVVYTQTFADLDIPKLIATLNTKRRVRKPKAKTEAAR
jgi:hypothetical protein